MTMPELALLSNLLDMCFKMIRDKEFTNNSDFSHLPAPQKAKLGQENLLRVYLTIRRRFSWPSLAMCTNVA